MHLTLRHHKTATRSIATLTMLAATFLSVTVGQTAEPLVLSLDESIAIAMNKDLGYKKVVNSEQSAEFGFLAARANYRPQISFSGLSPDRTELTREQFDFQSGLFHWVRTGSSLYRGNIGISQRLPTDGRISFTSYLHRKNQYNTVLDKTSRSREYQSYGHIYFSQPLFQQSPEKMNRERSKINWSKAKQSLRKGESDLIYNVTEAFLSLFKAEESLSIAREQEKLSSSAYDIAVSRRDAGVEDEIEVLRTQSELAANRGRTLTAEAGLRTKSLEFKKLLRIDLEQPVTLQKPEDITIPSVDLQEVLTKARENNSEIRQAEFDCEMSRLELWNARKTGGLSADLGLYYNLTGTDSLFNTSYKEPNRNTQIRFEFTLPLYDSGRKRAQISQSKINLENSDVTLSEANETVEQNVRLAVANLEDSQARVEQARITLQYNRKLNDQALAKYKLGQFNTYELLQAQVGLAAIQKNELDARIARRLALAKLEQLTQTSWH